MRTFTRYVSRFLLILIFFSAVSLGNAAAQPNSRLIVIRAANFGWNLAVNLKIDGRTVANVVQGRRYNRFQRLDLQQRQGRPATFIFYSFFIFGIGATLLQLYNVAALGAFWPFLTGIVFQVMAAVFQFARMILVLPE